MRHAPLIFALAAVALGGCTTTSSETRSSPGWLLGTADTPVGAGPEILPAVIYEIDGERVSHRRRGHRLAPGAHRVRVAPRRGGPAGSMRGPGYFGAQAGMKVLALPLTVEPGHRYYLGARFRRYRVLLAGDDPRTAPWEEAIVPVVVRETSRPFRETSRP